MKRNRNDDAHDATDPSTEENGARTRRQLLKLAGGAAIGGGMVLAGADRASAANGGNFILGSDANTATNFTELNMGSGLAIASLSVGVDGISGSAAALQAQGTSVDLKMNGTGRLGMLGTVSGLAQPTDGPVLNDLVKASNGTLWSGVGALGTGTWRRLNAVRVDNPSGTGAAFAPFRLYDSRDSSIRTVGTATHVDVHASANIPDDAIAVFGNLTVTSPNYSGWVTLWPRGVAEPTTSSINFTTGQTVANFFFVGLGTGANEGFVSFVPRKSGAGTGNVHVILDITAYVQ